ncbi:MAG: hypothetical protein R6V28_00980 [Nitriliruptoraceae bacterium]
MPSGATDTASEVFTARLAKLLRTARGDRGTSLRETARATAGAATGRQLRAIEAAEADLTRFDVAAIAAAYGLDLSASLAERIPLDVDLGAGILHTAGNSRRFTPGDTDALLLAYLLLVRDLRGLPKGSEVVVRRDDVEVLARHLGADAAKIVDRLADLMGATDGERRSIVGLFAAGATVLVLAMSAVARQSGCSPGLDDASSSRDRRPAASPVSPLTPPPPPTASTSTPTTGATTPDG